jgi:thioesterase domain-containing protein/acyl carrier protein
LGKIRSDGQLVHLGRIDNMVKIKGVRIELESIDKLLSEFPGVVSSASRVVMDRRGNQKLAAYYVPEIGMELTVSDIRKFLTVHLQSQLIPNYIIKLESLPLTPSGKIDRKSLPPPQFVRPNLANPYKPPRDELEKKLVNLWETEIGIEGIGVDDDFFDLGGDSLIGVMLFISIEKALGRSLPVSVLLTAPTIDRQAELIRNSSADDDLSPIIPIRPTGALTPIFFIPGRGVYPTRIRHLAERVSREVPIYALHNLSGGFEMRAFRSMEALAAFYVTIIRKTVSQGPVILIGESMGGKVALEVAQQLIDQGDEVPYLMMLDTFRSRSTNHIGPNYSLGYSGMLVSKHTNILFRSGWKGRLEYLKFYVGFVKNEIREFFLRQVGSENLNGSAIPMRLKKLEQAYLKLADTYEPKVYPGKVIMFKALRGGPHEDSANGWDSKAFGDFIIHSLDCYHGSMLFDPAVTEISNIVMQYINRLTEKGQQIDANHHQ